MSGTEIFLMHPGHLLGENRNAKHKVGARGNPPVPGFWIALVGIVAPERVPKSVIEALVEGVRGTTCQAPSGHDLVKCIDLLAARCVRARLKGNKACWPDR
jgi:hypothetical protein